MYPYICTVVLPSSPRPTCKQELATSNMEIKVRFHYWTQTWNKIHWAHSQLALDSTYKLAGSPGVPISGQGGIEEGREHQVTSRSDSQSVRFYTPWPRTNVRRQRVWSPLSGKQQYLCAAWFSRWVLSFQISVSRMEVKRLVSLAEW